MKRMRIELKKIKTMLLTLVIWSGLALREWTIAWGGRLLTSPHPSVAIIVLTHGLARLWKIVWVSLYLILRDGLKFDDTAIVSIIFLEEVVDPKLFNLIMRCCVVALVPLHFWVLRLAYASLFLGLLSRNLTRLGLGALVGRQAEVELARVYHLVCLEPQVDNCVSLDLRLQCKDLTSIESRSVLTEVITSFLFCFFDFFGF